MHPRINSASGSYFCRESFCSLKGTRQFLASVSEGLWLILEKVQPEGAAKLTEFREGLSRWVFTASTFRVIVSTLQPSPKTKRSLNESFI